MTPHKTPPQLVWTAHGAPAIDGCETAGGSCFVCVGDIERGQPVKTWLKSSYTDQNRARCITATHVCEACCYVHSRTSPVLGRPAKEGKRFGGNMRNYSHLWEGGWAAPAFGDGGESANNYANASKGQKPLIREFLEREHASSWFAAIADSGQKHVLPLTTLNGPGRSGNVLFDELLVTVPGDVSLVAQMADLLTAGATKEAIETGDYHWGVMSRCAREVQAFERENARHRGMPWFTLAVWLAQRDEEAVAARQAAEKEAAKAKKEQAKAAKKPRKEAKREADGRAKKPARNAGGGSAAGGQSVAPGKQRSKPAEALGDVGDTGKKRGETERERGRVGDAATTRHDGHEPHQLGFTFGD